MEIEKNVKSLNDRVKMTGFGESHEVEIRIGMKTGRDQFIVNISCNEKGVMTDNNLIFNKDTVRNDWYYFNEYESRITNRPEDEIASRVVKERVNTKFPKNTITLDESISLRLTGSVEKEISYLKMNEVTGVEEVKKFSIWRKADQTKLNEYNQFPLQSFSYRNLEADLRKRAIVGKNDPEIFKEMLSTLKAGWAIEVVLKDRRIEMKKWLAVDAASQEKLKLYDSNPREAVVRTLKLNQDGTDVTVSNAKNVEQSSQQQGAQLNQQTAAHTSASIATEKQTSTEQASVTEARVIPMFTETQQEQRVDSTKTNLTTVEETKLANREQTKGKTNKVTPTRRKKNVHKI